jgi:PST family polysaccharide transporter
MPNESIDQVTESVRPVANAGKEQTSGSPHGSGRLRKNIAALSVLQLLNYALPIAVVPYLVRVLGPVHYGMLVFAQASVNYANSLTDYGFNYSATRLVARHREEPEVLSRIFWSTAAAKTLLMLACFAVLALLVAAVPLFRLHATLVAACSLLVLGNVLFPMWFFQGMEEMGAITTAQAIAKMSLIPLVFLLVKSPEHLVRAAALQSGTAVVAGIIGIPLLFRTAHLTWYKPRLSDVIDSFREGWHVFMSTAAITVYTSTNTVVLGFMSGEAQVGYFGAANRIINGSQGVLIPITQALYPHLNSMAAKSRNAAVSLIRKSLLWIMLISVAASLVFLLGAEPISHIVLSRKFDGSIVPLRWMAVLPILLGLSNVFGVQTMLTFGMNKEFNRIVTSSAVINVLLTFPFAYFWGAAGAAIAIVLTELFVTTAMFLKVRSMGLLASPPPGRETL